MGQTLAKAAEYTSVAESGEKKLALVKTNEDILNKIITFVESYPGDATEKKLEFCSSLSWNSTLKPENISQWPASDQTKDGQPVGAIKAKGSGYEVGTWNLEQVAAALSAAADNKMNEARNCLEANIDPTAVILGDRFATVSAIADTDAYFRYKEEVRKDQEKEGAAEDPEVKEKVLRLNMLNHIRNLDMTMKDEALQLKQEDFKVSAQSVEDQFNVLQRCAGEDEDNNALFEICYVDPYIHRFANGCRAPFWKQVHGHISYIEAKPHDTDNLYIIACTSGFYCTGYDKEKNELTFETESETYKRLSDLLMAKSPKFAELIGKQHIFERREEKRGIMDTDDHDYDREKDGEQTQRSEKMNEGKGGKSQQHKKKTTTTKKLEPSLKWKVLGIEEEDQKKKVPTATLR